MHLKNFSMIHSGATWTLAPAYDLLNMAIVNPNDTEELALTIEEKKRRLQWENFEQLRIKLRLNERQIKRNRKTLPKKQTHCYPMDQKFILIREIQREIQDFARGKIPQHLVSKGMIASSYCLTLSYESFG